MQTRKDQVQAYQFAMGRLSTALVSGDPGGGDSPTKRASLGTFLGAGMVVLLCAVFGVFGLIRPVATTSWKKDGAVVVNEENGNRFLYADKELHPVLNLASAMLISPGPAAAPQSLSAKSLAGVPIGPAVGIQNAPDAVPSPSSLLTGPWTRCLRPGTVSGQVIDFQPTGHTSAYPDDRQLLLAGPDGTRYLLANGVKYRVDGDATLITLGMEDQRALSAPENWLSDVPSGPVLAAPKVPGKGEPAGQVAGRPVRVGDLFRTNGVAGSHYFVLLADGVASVSATEAALMSTEPGTAQPRTVAATDIAIAPVSKNRDLMHSLPDMLGMRPLDAKGAVVCLRQQSDGPALHNKVVLERGQAATGSRLVLIPPGHGVLAVDQAQVNAQGATPQEFLVTEDGLSFALGNDQAASALGFGKGGTLALPESVISLLPSGPVLSRTVATATVRRG